ncbi:uncharacterized protein KZ484_022291 [Pholidichthys leucotaenia]
MEGSGTLLRLLLLHLIFTGVRSDPGVFVYYNLGGSALLPCSSLPSSFSSCSSVSWTFYRGGQVIFTWVVEGGQVRTDTDKYGRLSVTSSCSIRIRDLREEDAGSYVCRVEKHSDANVYLSLLSISSDSSVMELRPGGTLLLTCILFTYYDAGSCKNSYSSSIFHLSWTGEDRSPLRDRDRYQLFSSSPCNISLALKLQQEDDSRRFRCQVNTSDGSRGTFLDFRTSFLLLSSPQEPPVSAPCPVDSPISRISLCVALPVMVAAVGVYTWRSARQRERRGGGGGGLMEVREA